MVQTSTPCHPSLNRLLGDRLTWWLLLIARPALIIYALDRSLANRGAMHVSPCVAPLSPHPHPNLPSFLDRSLANQGAMHVSPCGA
ncbi:MAG TPA: hypothetical protein VLY63_11630, partial [Anaerolineae bacterium]|nr:hypothetical protein [Anaerolineae bacterium]